MKKIVCVLVLACVIMGAAFAQQKPATPAAPAAPAKTAETSAKNAVAIDVFRLFDGLTSFGEDIRAGSTLSFAYERQIVPHWSLGPDLDLGFFGTRYVYYGWFNFILRAAAEGRYYPLANFDKVFLGATFGFVVDVVSTYGIGSPYYYSPYVDADFGLSVFLKVGYKLITSKKFYLEPSIAYGYEGSSALLRGGLRLGFAF